MIGWVGIFVLRALSWSIGLLPRPWQLRIGDAIGAVFRWNGMREKVVRQNLDFAFPGRENEKTRERIFNESYRSFGRLIIDVLMIFGPIQRFGRHSVEVLGFENWERARDEGKGVIFASSHVGCWEMMAIAAGQRDVNLTIVTKHLKPEWLHQLVHRCRAAFNCGGAYEPFTLKTVNRELGAGRTVGFIMDQYVGPPKGVRVPFFGVPVGSNVAVAALSKRTGAPVIPVLNYRKPDGSYVVELQPRLEWVEHENPHEELARNTAQLVSKVEEHVRAHPEQWLWIHRRFKGDLGPLRPGEWGEARVRSHEQAAKKRSESETRA